jgi:hypothetical protein
MAIAFPPAPSVGQTYTYMTQEWIWNGKGWAFVVAPSSPGVAVTMTTTFIIKGTFIPVPQNVARFTKV